MGALDLTALHVQILFNLHAATMRPMSAIAIPAIKAPIAKITNRKGKLTQQRSFLITTISIQYLDIGSIVG